MKAGDLRIGNWYQSVKWDVPVRCELPDLYNLSALADGADDDPPIDEMFEPIPITKEWLISCSVFETFGIGEYKSRKYTIRETETIYNADWFYIKFETTRLKGKVPCAYRYGKRLCVIQYVHQLQNLYYALTGKELTIKQ
jgi:hypothetical protein